MTTKTMTMTTAFGWGLCMLGGCSAEDETFDDLDDTAALDGMDFRDAPETPPPTCTNVPDTNRANMLYHGQPMMDGGAFEFQGTTAVPHTLFMDVSTVCGDDVEISGIAKIHDENGDFADAIAVVGPLKKSGDDPLVIITARIGADGTATNARCNRFNWSYNVDPEGLAAWSGGLYVAEENPSGTTHDGQIHYFTLSGIDPSEPDGDPTIAATLSHSFSSPVTDDLEGLTTTSTGDFLIGTGKVAHQIHHCGGDPGPNGALTCNATTVTMDEASSLGTYCDGGTMRYTVSADSGSISRGFTDTGSFAGAGLFQWKSNKGKDEAVELIGNDWYVGYDEGGFENEVHVYGFGNVCMDASGDGVFDSNDFVLLGGLDIFEADASCEDGQGNPCAGPHAAGCDCRFVPGDCDGDYRYTSNDLVQAFILDHYVE